MAQFWWVNHNQTARQEFDGLHLWSPKTESNGARSEFYNDMRRAAPGDLTLSYAGQAVRYWQDSGIRLCSETNGVRRDWSLLESRGMASADRLDTVFTFDPSQNNSRESRPAPAGSPTVLKPRILKETFNK
jgi:hypothetical protein